MKRATHFIACICAVAIMMSAVFVPNVFAEENYEARNKALFVEEVVKFLSIYARYDEVTQQKLYKEGLLYLIEKHPELYEEALHGVLESIDEHSEYYNEEETKLLKENITGTITGIGITFQMCDEGVNVMSVIAETPAANGGLQVGDIIVSADGNNLAGMNSDTAASYIKGEEGTSVRIGIKRKDESDIIYVDLVREKIIGESVSHTVMTDGDQKLMYVKVYGFVTNTAEKFGAALNEAASAGIERLVIDLRDNGGGLFDQAIMMADMLVPKGSLITTEDHKIPMLNVEYRAQMEDTMKFDTVVLVNENSASASEVLAAALSENESATIIGTKTYGKGTIQTVSDMKYGDSIKYTVGYYLTPLGNNINGIGITPDAVVENTTTPFEIEKYEKFTYSKVYNVGDEGSEVKTAKELLEVWGTYSGAVNETYDDALFDAVKSFQSMTGLYPYGVLDLTTQRELYTRLQKSKVVHDDQLDAAFSYYGMTREKK